LLHFIENNCNCSHCGGKLKCLHNTLNIAPAIRIELCCIECEKTVIYDPNFNGKKAQSPWTLASNAQLAGIGYEACSKFFILSGLKSSSKGSWYQADKILAKIVELKSEETMKKNRESLKTPKLELEPLRMTGGGDFVPPPSNSLPRNYLIHVAFDGRYTNPRGYNSEQCRKGKENFLKVVHI